MVILLISSVMRLSKTLKLLTLALALNTVQAQEFTVHHNPGGVSDIVTRELALHMPTWYVQNRPGAGGRTAIRHLHNRQAIVLATVPQIFVTNMLSANPGYSSDDLEILAVVAVMNNVLVCNQAQRPTVASLKQPTTYAVAGIGSNEHLSTVVLAKELALPADIIPYAQGGNRSVMDVLAGTVNCGFFNKPTINPYVNDPRLVVLLDNKDWPKPWPYPSYLAVVTDRTNPQLEQTRQQVQEAIKANGLKERITSLGLTAVLRSDKEAIEQVHRANQNLKKFIIDNKLVLD